jgi:tRNA(His) guanylyltransferase
MNPDAFERRMRIFETTADHCVLPEIFMVARLDGRNFTRLTHEVQAFEAPFDERFRDFMVETTLHLMTCGFRVIYSYTESDEISLLFDKDEEAFNRKLRKLNSILAGEASAKFSLLLRDIGAFDCRISQLPTAELVVDYFRWRQADAHRNALNAHCYWLLRGEGQSAVEATHSLLSASTASKNELLFQRGINFNDLPNWQKRGIGLYWETYQKQGNNPLTGESSLSNPRRRIKQDFDLPMKDQYDQFILNLIVTTVD